MPKEDPPGAAFSNSASATIKVDLSKATLLDLLIHSPTDSPKDSSNKLPYPRSLTSGLIEAGCISRSTLVCTPSSPMPSTPKIGPHVSLKSISQSEMDEMSFGNQFLEEETSSAASAPSAAKRIRLEAEEVQYSAGSKVQEEATSSLSVEAKEETTSLFSAKAPEEGLCFAGSKASPFTSLSQKVYPLFARTRSDESTASNASERSYFSMAAPPSFTGGGGGAKAPAEK